jgi:putative DNA primase/helicase
MKMNVTDTVKQACGHWPRILPALGMKVIKNRHQACPVCGGLTASALTIKRARHMVL